MNTSCPFDLEKVLSDCEMRDMEPVQAVAWRRLVQKSRPPSEPVEGEILFVKRDPVEPRSQLVDLPTRPIKASESHIEAIILCRREAAYMLVLTEQSDGRWTIGQIKTEAFDFEDEELWKEAIETGLGEVAFVDVAPKLREYTHFPSQEDLADFMAFSEWSSPLLYHRVVWEGSQTLSAPP